MTFKAWLASQRNISDDKRWQFSGVANGVLAGMPKGVRVDGQFLQERDRTPLATYLHRPRRDHDKDVIRLALPNPLTIGRHRRIVKGLRALGVEGVLMPHAIIDAARIRATSLEVVATHRAPGFFRAEEQVIRAEVSYDAWSGWRRTTRFRTAYFLAGYDRNEPGLSYFFCELPPGAEPKSVAEAYVALKPESVKIAEKVRRKILRQGDMFFIQDKAFRPRHDEQVLPRSLHGSNHVGETIRRDGLLYATGTIKHDPWGREPDHKPLKLPPGWWLCVRNTVPVTGPER